MKRILLLALLLPGLAYAQPIPPGGTNSTLDSIKIDTTDISADTEDIRAAALTSDASLTEIAAAVNNGKMDINVASSTEPTKIRASENYATAQTNNELIAAQGSGVKICIQSVILSNGATAGDIKIVEDTAGTPVDVIENTYVAINGGAVMTFPTAVCGTANKNLGFTSATVTTHSVTVVGYAQ